MKSKKKLAVLLSVCLCTSVALPSGGFFTAGMSQIKAAQEEEGSDSTITQYDGYRMVWNDEFDGEYLDQTKWVLGNTPENGSHKYNMSPNPEGELENENVYLKDGKLRITATDVEDYKENGKQYVCNSGMVETLGKASWRYGRFDVRARLPVTKGMWPAIWMMPEKQPIGWPDDGEIDIMELISQEKNTAYGTLHCGTYNSPDYWHPTATYKLKSGTYFDDYHLFSMEWEPGVIRMYVDNIKYATFTDWVSVTRGGVKHDFPHPFNANFYFKLNVATGAANGKGWCENPDASTQWGEKSTMDIDYVRVYKKEAPAYDYTKEAFSSSKQPQGAVWYAQIQKEGNSFQNMENFNISSSSWKKDGQEITRNSMTPADLKTAIGFDAPEDGYIRMNLKDIPSSDSEFKLSYTKGTKEESQEVIQTFSSSKENGTHQFPEATKNIYMKVKADDFIRIEAEGEGSKIEQITPVISYISKEVYEQGVEGKLPAEVKIMGDPVVGQQLSCALLDGNLSYTDAVYRWKADGVNIPNATDRIFIPTTNETGKILTVQMKGSNGTVIESSPSAPVERPVPMRFVDDKDSTIGYTGFQVANREDAQGGSFHWSKNQEASNITYSFFGTGIDVLAYTHTAWKAKHSVVVKDREENIIDKGIADCEGPDQGKAAAYSIKGLPQGSYTIEIINDGTKNKIEFDGFNVYQKEPEPSPPYETHALTYSGGKEVQGENPPSAFYSEGAEVLLPANPYTKEGWEFAGWNDGEKTYEAGAIYSMPDKEVQFTAVWSGVKPPETNPPETEQPSLAKPAKVAGLGSTSGTDSIKLKWKKALNAAEYVVEYYDNSSKKWAALGNTKALTYTHKRLKYGTQYRYRVTGYNRSGLTVQKGISSNMHKTWTAPKKPKLSAKKSAGQKVRLTWKKDTRADQFQIFMKAGKGKYKRLKISLGKKTYYTKPGMKKNVAYQFKIRGFIKNGSKKIYSPYSAQKRIVFK